ncbi:hypothetical protein LOK85_12335 [Xylella fastidiosa subsp. multiplex]|uniref:hypothetical protein n=1 Tax=Xylella fastidiosa TaxID=2371 RepID=UPI00234C8998|nr:hypothetical protein [Xylella fastidiosa]MDC6416660.1 hypothetical protein [Xylella fastidiosa subsp. multiplex]
MQERAEPYGDCAGRFKDYQTEQDRVTQFIKDECVLGMEHEEKISTPMGGGLYPAYTQWCKEAAFMRCPNPFSWRIGTVCAEIWEERGAGTVEVGKRRRVLLIQGIGLVDAGV